MPFRKLDKKKLLQDLLEDLEQMSEEELKRLIDEYNIDYEYIKKEMESDRMNNKLTWDDLRENNIAIHTPTEEIMKLVINTGVEALNSEDIYYEKCGNGHIFYEYDTETCVKFRSVDGTWGYGSFNLYKDDGFEIVEYKDIKHLFENCINTTETEEIQYLAKVKLKNGEEGYFMEEWGQGEYWIYPTEDVNYADIFSNKYSLKETLALYKDEIESYEILKQIIKTITTYELEN